MTKESRITVFLLVASILLFSVTVQNFSRAADASQLATTQKAIANAFVAVSTADSAGGNVTTLVAKLNLALNLTEQAQSINATDPSGAAALLQNASSIASQVQTDAASIKAAGQSARQMLVDESIGGAAAVVIIAALLFAFGDRIYRLLWFSLYRNYIVKGRGEESSG